MAKKTKKPSPEFTGNLGVALWKKQDKNGKEYFTVKIDNICNVFTPLSKD